MQPTCFKWSNQFEKDNIIMSYKGEFNADLINSILSITYQDAHIRQSKDLIKNRLFSVIVESLQNIHKHGVLLNNDDDGARGLFLVRKTEDSYCIYTGNFLKKSTVDILTSKIEQVRTADYKKLVALQKSVLKNTKLKDDGGAGIGLIEISKKTSHLEYTFTDYNEDITFFSLEAEISTLV